MNAEEKEKAEKLLEELKDELEAIDSSIEDLRAQRAETKRHIRKIEKLLKGEKR